MYSCRRRWGRRGRRSRVCGLRWPRCGAWAQSLPRPRPGSTAPPLSPVKLSGYHASVMEGDAPLPVTAASPPEPPPAAAAEPAGPAWMREPRRLLAFEVLAVLGVGWFYSYFYVVADHVWPERISPPAPFWYSWLQRMVIELPFMALVVIVARR